MSDESERITVLYVDDEPGFRERVATRLDHDRFAVLTETNPDDALARLATARVDCLVSEHDAPALDGLALLERARETYPDLPFVLFTANGSEALAAEAVSAGATDYLPKDTSEPVASLARRVEGAVARALDRAAREAALRAERDRAAALFEQLGEPAVEVGFGAGGDEGDAENRGDEGSAANEREETPVVRAVNAAFEATFGREESALVGRPLAVAVGDRERVRDSGAARAPASEADRACYRGMARGEVVERELRRETPDGPRTFLFRSVPFAVDDERRAYGIYVDVTERKRQRERFEEFIRRSTDVISVLDRDGTIRYQSPSAERLFGSAPEEMVARRALEFVHPDDRAAVAAKFEQAVADPDETRTMVFRFRHADGTWRWLEAVGNNQLDNPAVEGFIVNSRDVTERNEHEQVLETLHDATRELMAAATKEEVAELAGEIAADILDLPVNGVHLYEEREDGLVPVATTTANREIIGEPPTVHPGDGLAWEVYETGEPQFHADVREASDAYNPDTAIRSEFLLPLGEHGVFIVSSTTVDDFDDADATLARVLAANVEAALDRADREEEVTAQYREVRRQNERLNEFASIVSHDMQNPLNVASGRVALAREEPDGDHLEIAADALDRMGQLIDRTLELAQQGRTVGETEPVDLRTLTERCWRTVETNGAELTVADDLECVADGERLQQLFENLFRNAVEHGSTSSRASRDDAVEHGGERVTITVGALADGAGFYVEDDGPGIPAAERETVFESGYTTGEDGMGFGLAIVEEIVEAHGWTVGVTDGGDGGARFEIATGESK